MQKNLPLPIANHIFIPQRANNVLLSFVIAALLTSSIVVPRTYAMPATIPDDVGYQVTAPGVITMSVENPSPDSAGVKADLVLENQLDLWVGISLTPSIDGQSIYTTDAIAATFIRSGIMPPGGKFVLKAHFTDTSQYLHVDESQNNDTALLNLLTPLLSYIGGLQNESKILLSMARLESSVLSDIKTYYDWHDFFDFINDPLSWKTFDRLQSTAGHVVSFFKAAAGQKLVHDVLTDAGITQLKNIDDALTVLSLLKTIAHSIAYDYMLVRYGSGSYSFVPIDSGHILHPPLPPNLISPVNVSTVNNPPTFQWSKRAYTDSYHFDLSTSNSFSTLVYSADTAQSSLTPPLSLAQNTQYFWRVAGRNTAGQGSFSNTAVFIIGDVIYPPGPSPTPEDATFVADVTIPDDTTLNPGLSFTKTWRMKNTGTSTWGSGYSWVYTNGDQMNAPGSISVPSTAPNNTLDLSVNMTAPNTPGIYTGYWRMRNPQGIFFGDTVFVKVIVPGAPSVTADIKIVSPPPAVVLSPGQTYQPQITIQPVGIQLLQSRGDLLRNTDGNLYGAWPHVAVVGTVNPGQNYTFTFYQNNPITAPNNEGTYESKWRVWANGTYVGPEITIQFDVRQSGSNRRPNKPQPTNQNGGANDWYVSQDGSQVKLCAQQNGDPDGDAIVAYEFDVTGPNTWNSSEVANSCTTTSGLGPYGYAWSVRVKDSRGAWSDYSDLVWHFNIISQVVTFDFVNFNPPSPSNTDQVTIFYCMSGAAAGGESWVNTAYDGSASGEWRGLKALIAPCDSATDAPTWPTLDFDDGTHLVRLVGIGTNGNRTIWEGTYTLNRRRPGWAVLINPASNAWLNNRTITFQWQPALRANSYTLYVSTNPDPTQSPIIQQTFGSGTTSYVVTLGADYPQLYWMVRATNELGSTDSQTGQLGIDRAAPNAAVTALPATTYETSFSVTWGGTDSSSGIRWYDVQYRDGNRPESEWVDWQLNVTKTVSIFIGLPGHAYYFRTRALDNAGNLQAYSGGNGDTFTNVDPGSAPPTPWWNAAYAFKRMLLVVNNDSHTLDVGYPIRIHFDTTTTPTAAELYNASKSATKGDDFRVLYNDTTELNRFVRRFNATEIDIWFNLQQTIAPTPASAAASYQLYYGNAAASKPPESVNAVFFPPNDGNVVGLWHFSDATGSTVADTSGRGHAGSATGGFSWGVNGKSGPYMDFDGSSSYVDAGNPSDFTLNTFTLEAWVYPRSGQGGAGYAVVGKAKPDNASAYGLSIAYGEVAMNTDGGGPIRGGSVAFDHWNHVAATFDGSTGRVYLNGTLVSSGSTSVPPLTSSSLLIGRTAAGYPDNTFNGYIQGVRVSNVARTSFPYGQFALVTNEPSTAAGSLLQPPVSGKPDLSVQSLLAVLGDSNNKMVVQATVSNQGNAATQDGFYIDLYANHQPTGPGDYSNIGQFWVASPISAGSSISLTTVLTNTAGLFSRRTRKAAANETSATLYLQADSSGVLIETDKTNNISTGTQICTTSADSYEADNTTATANLIALDSPQTHNFDLAGDQDWVKFTAQSGISYTLQTSNLGANADTYLYLFNTDGTILLSSNDDNNGTLASRIDWQAPTSGTYYAMVKHWNPNMGGCGTSYDVAVSLQNPQTVTIEEGFAGIQYGNWLGMTDLGAGGGTYRVSKTKNAKAIFTFKGTSVKWLSLKGPDQGKAQVLIDGVNKGTIDLYSPTLQYQFSKSFGQLSNVKHALIIQVLGTKNSNASDTKVAVDAFIVGTTTTQDNSTAIQYGDWSGRKSAGASGGTFRFSGALGAVVKFGFTGTSVEWITAKGPSYGKAKVLIDGLQVGKTIDLYASTQQWQFSKPFTGLSAGSHTIQIMPLGTKRAASTGTAVVVDAFRGPISPRGLTLTDEPLLIEETPDAPIPTLTPGATVTPSGLPTAEPTATLTSTEVATATETVTTVPTRAESQTPTITPQECSGSPDKPILVAPDNNTKLQQSRVTLEWNSSNCALTYTLIVKQDSKKGTNADRKSNFAGLRYTTKALPASKTYFWQVEACNTFGCVNSNWWQFKVEANASP